MAIILNSLHVDCYRGIKALELDEFNHVNILVGDNNAGKTSVMEMICALQAPLSLNVWNEIAKKKNDSYRGTRYYSAYRNIFPIDCDKRIAFTGDFYGSDSRSVCMTAEEYRTTISERELNRLNGLMRTGKQNEEDTYVDTTVLELCITANSEEVEFEVYDFQKRPPRRQMTEYGTMEVITNTAFIEPRDGLENDFSYMKKAILDSEYHDQLVEILREFDPAIMGILAVEEMGNTVYYVRTSEHTNAVPISVYGDGLKKALIIFAALASNKDGIVLIDEVEASIHTSAMNKVFSTLISWARRLNIQLFISTHSKEALNILLNCDSEYQEGINVYTLYRNEQKNYVRKLSCLGALDLQNRMGMEIR